MSQDSGPVLFLDLTSVLHHELPAFGIILISLVNLTSFTKNYVLVLSLDVQPQYTFLFLRTASR
jgi:hypothetical protein